MTVKSLFLKKLHKTVSEFSFQNDIVILVRATILIIFKGIQLPTSELIQLPTSIFIFLVLDISIGGRINIALY